MKTFYYILMAVLGFNLLYAQDNGLVILEENTKTHYEFKAYNPLSDPIEITFELKDVSGLDYNSEQVVKLIQPQDTTVILKLKKTSNNIGFLMSYQQILIPNKLYDPEDFTKYETGIVVFSKDGCPRCSYTTDYLIRKKVDFTLLNISQNEAYNQYMWDKLKAQGQNSKVIRTPIIMVNNVLSHSHQDLNWFVKQLAKL